MHSSEDGSEGAMKQFFDSILPKSTASAERNDEASQLDWYQEHKRAILVGIQRLWSICLSAQWRSGGHVQRMVQMDLMMVVYPLMSMRQNLKHRKAQNGVQQWMTAIRIEQKQVYLALKLVKSKQAYINILLPFLLLFPPPFFPLFVQPAFQLIRLRRIKNTPSDSYQVSAPFGRCKTAGAKKFDGDSVSTRLFLAYSLITEFTPKRVSPSNLMETLTSSNTNLMGTTGKQFSPVTIPARPLKMDLLEARQILDWIFCKGPWRPRTSPTTLSSGGNIDLRTYLCRSRQYI